MENTKNVKNTMPRMEHYLSAKSKKKNIGEFDALFSISQKIALVSMTLAALWATLSIVIATLMNLQSNFALFVFGFMTVLAWILIPLYFKRKKGGYVLGIILLILGLFGLFASPGNPAWYTFVNPVSIVKELTFVINSIFGIYFSYRSFIEMLRGEAHNG